MPGGFDCLRVVANGLSGEVCPSEFCIVSQGGIDYQLDIKSRRCGWCFMCGQRHEESGGVDDLAFRVS